MSHLVKNVMNGLLRPFHQEIRRREKLPSSDAFGVQAHLTSASHPVIFDVGAYIGDVTARYLIHFPAGQVHAFEPFPATFTRLRQRFQDDGRVITRNLAVSDQVGTVDFHVNQSNATNSLLPSDPQAPGTWGQGLLDHRETQSVSATTLDVYCRDAALPHIDLLKLDIQGAELKALSGARSLLEKGGIGLVYLEVIYAPTYVGQPTMEDYLRFFRDVGYSLVDFYDPVRKDHRLIQADLLFTRPR